MLERRRVGEARPLTYPVAIDTRRAIREYLDRFEDIQLVMAARNSVEPEAGVMILAAVSEPTLPPGFEQGLVEVVQESRGDAVAVQVFALHASRPADADGSDSRPEPEEG